MHLWHDVSLGENAPDEVTLIVENPKGNNNKYEIDKETGVIALDRVLFSAVFYPADYGFIPQTLWEDGDALDAFVLTTNPLFPGCLASVRPIGLIKMIDGGESDDKLITVPTEDPRFKEIKDIKDLPSHLVDEITNFLSTYKILEKKEVEIIGVEGAAAAKKTIEKGITLYKEKFAK